ncbi:hypothetical protein CONLIGDRAFT_42870 [Coniochaeta ligniaria NRRL 30616]|uniref:Uncharacterized protein n=1 Tax=Coniochaeta ligniaria NRRL 30616 TaxID=1408157 RepID=A0A1J7JP19_9PEZI|nr:hypothetical protein CONLIGDRAFT_42870 [Coniochaeta ligniaria NRRL 30616]
MHALRLPPQALHEILKVSHIRHTEAVQGMSISHKDGSRTVVEAEAAMLSSERKHQALGGRGFSAINKSKQGISSRSHLIVSFRSSLLAHVLQTLPQTCCQLVHGASRELRISSTRASSRPLRATLLLYGEMRHKGGNGPSVVQCVGDMVLRKSLTMAQHGQAVFASCILQSDVVCNFATRLNARIGRDGAVIPPRLAKHKP